MASFQLSKKPCMRSRWKWEISAQVVKSVLSLVLLTGSDWIWSASIQVPRKSGGEYRKEDGKWGLSCNNATHSVIFIGPDWMWGVITVRFLFKSSRVASIQVSRKSGGESVDFCNNTIYVWDRTGFYTWDEKTTRGGSSVAAPHIQLYLSDQTESVLLLQFPLLNHQESHQFNCSWHFVAHPRAERKEEVGMELWQAPHVQCVTQTRLNMWSLLQFPHLNHQESHQV